MKPRVVHFYFPIFGTLFIPIDTESTPNISPTAETISSVSNLSLTIPTAFEDVRSGIIAMDHVVKSAWIFYA